MKILFLKVLTVAAACVFILAYCVEMYQYSTASRCEATVLGISVEKDPEAGTYYKAEVEYDVGDATYWANNVRVDRNCVVGQQIRIRYLPRQPWVIPQQPSLLETLFLCAASLFILHVLSYR